ncbi:hypothetical protein [Paracoccus pacificus]|uniref:DUF805 domain-containing protein n=1 Tax=Paracoccus pacificus TaxID=1463598 RepID=A0ABW4R4J8_9RHOB
MNPSGGIIEEEWVDTGPEFALSHPLSQSLGGIWWIIAWCVLTVLASAYFLAIIVLDILLFGNLNWLSLLLLPLNLLTLIVGLAAIPCLFLRNPMASALVWIVLVLTLMVPLMFYWNSGTRPNLIYRHRFSRLMRADPAEGNAA